MLGEVSLALPDMGVVQQHIYTEPYFDAVHDPDREVVARIRERFVATDLFSTYAARRGSAFDIDRDIEAARTGKAGNGDPLAVSDLFELLPAFLSHHPDEEDPAPTHVERPGTGRAEAGRAPGQTPWRIHSWMPVATSWTAMAASSTPTTRDRRSIPLGLRTAASRPAPRSTT